MNIRSVVQKLRASLGIFMLVASFYIFWVWLGRTPVRSGVETSTHSEDSHSIEDSIRQKPRTILLWDKFFKESRWTSPANRIGPGYLKFKKCPEANCVVTNDKNYLPSPDRFDAILFYMTSQPKAHIRAPTTRNPAQLYVFTTLESPLFASIDMTKNEEFFNLTMSYRLDSDILWPYWSMEDIESGLIVAPAVKPHWRQPPAKYADEELEAFVKAKTKFAVWFVSHCHTPSKREDVVADLQKYVTVDVYGDCGTLVCKRFVEDCDKMVNRDYKFYFSFENSLCIDYVTEKFGNGLRLQVIPVVLGGADYSRFAPPHSYIDANNFTNIKELANYLEYLSDNPKDYIRYFWWRKYYQPKPYLALCGLCARLNSPSVGRKVQIYSDIRSWWTNRSCYENPRILQMTDSWEPDMANVMNFDVVL